jgi:hypothetical protein
LHILAGAENRCRLFTKCSQTVAHRKKDAIRCPDWFSPFPLYVRSNPGNVMDTTPQGRRRKSRSDLVHLRCLPSNQPATKIGQVAWAWKEIEAGLAAGMKLKEVWEAARKDGLDISYAQFRVYISRLRHRRQRSTAAPLPPSVGNGEPGLPVSLPSDPFNNLREQREKKKQSGFEYDPFSINKT